MAVPVVLDCDPGHDDALAIVLAAGDPRLKLLAISTVAGNQSLDKTTYNARLVCTAAGINGVPIAAGCDRPLAGQFGGCDTPRHVAHSVHGASGLDGIDLDPPTVPLRNGHAVELLYETILNQPEPVTVIATGPLTNVALLIQKHPSVIDRIHEIVFMGGSTERGNVTPYGEFNVVADPEAVEIVLTSHIPFTFCGLNATHQVLVSPAIVTEIREIGTKLAHMCADLMIFFSQTYRDIFDMREPPLHDPVAVARVIDPAIVTCPRFPVSIELRGEHTRGATVVDLHGVTGSRPNANVAINVDIPAFWDIMLKAIRVLG